MRQCTEKITAAAIKLGSQVYTGSNHTQIRNGLMLGGAAPHFGFETTLRPFVSRLLAGQIALKAKQVRKIDLDGHRGLLHSGITTFAEKEQP